MTSVPTEIIGRLDRLIDIGMTVGPSRDDRFYADSEALVPWRAAATAWLERVLGRDDAYTRQFVEASDGWYHSAAVNGTAILRHVKDDLEHGYLRRYSQLVATDLLADVWAQADELLGGGYKDAAASIGGAALEVGLRQIAAANSVDASGLRGIGALNVALARARVYSAVRQQQIDAWRLLRNAAAHGEHDTYSSADVRALLDGVRGVLSEHL